MSFLLRPQLLAGVIYSLIGLAGRVPVKRRCLNGRIILVAEDEPLVALDIVELLSDFGATVLTARNVQDALALIAGAKVCSAVLDINLAGDDCEPVCQHLSERAIPFLFHTGYSDAPVLKKWAAAPVISKPARIVEVLTGLNYALHRNPEPAGEPSA
jgi:CheY-like chemotaxis protein